MSGARGVLIQAVEGLKKANQSVNIYTAATGWISVVTHVGVEDKEVVCFVPAGKRNQQIFFPLEELKAVKITLEAAT